MGSAIEDAFGLTAMEYDRARRQLVLCFDEFYRAAVELISFAPDRAIEVLDLGAGTGLLSGLIATAFPMARLTLLDISPQNDRTGARTLRRPSRSSKVHDGRSGPAVY